MRGGRAMGRGRGVKQSRKGEVEAWRRGDDDN